MNQALLNNTTHAEHENLVIRRVWQSDSNLKNML
uniref:Uncharacterized protein n=1 Tax=Rhizophora mucronata TaxID=61149 RepID=A0A2P2PPT8_RHIMU